MDITKRTKALALCVAVGTIAGVPALAVAKPGPHVTITPSTAHKGQTLTIRGTGWRTGGACKKVAIARAGGGGTTFNAVVNGRGAFTFLHLVGPKFRTGRFAVTVRQRCRGTTVTRSAAATIR